MNKSMSINSILEAHEAMEAMEKCRPIVQPNPFDLQMTHSQLFGMNVIEAPVQIVPKLKLSDCAPVGDEFRAEFNAWLLEMFGIRDMSSVKPGMAYLFSNNIVIRPEDMARMRFAAYPKEN